MTITNYGTPMDTFFKDLEPGQSFIFHGMSFIKMRPLKEYAKDIPDFPEDGELPQGDHILLNAMNLADGMPWNFSDEDTVETPIMEVAIGVKAPDEIAGKVAEARNPMKNLVEGMKAGQEQAGVQVADMTPVEKVQAEVVGDDD